MRLALTRLGTAVYWYAGGLGVGLLFATVGGGTAAVIDAVAGVPARESGGLVAFILALPFTVCDGAALIALILTRRAMREGIARSSYPALARCRNLIVVAIVLVGIGLAANGFLVLFGMLGAMGLRTNGEFFGLVAGWAAQWPPLVGAIAALIYLAVGLRDTRLAISNDGRWWWDGTAWQAAAAGR